MYKYKLKITAAGVAVNLIPVSIVSLVLCIINTVKYQMYGIIIAGVFFVSLYIVLLLLFTNTSFCCINTDSISTFFMGVELGTVKFSDIKEVNILPAAGTKYNLGSNEVVITTDKKTVRIGLIECEKFINELNTAMDLKMPVSNCH